MTSEGHQPELTGIQLREKREALTLAAATLLGQMLFEFSRLDVDLGMCLVWVDDGRQMDRLNPLVNKEAFSARLVRLNDQVKEKFEDDPLQRSAYVKWHDSAGELRKTRNWLVHGRWDVDATGEHIVSVAGLPASSDQSEARYSVEDLRQVINVIRSLRSDLALLRKNFPL